MTTRIIDRKGRNAGLWMLVLLLHVMAIAPAAAQNPADYYTTSQVYGTRPNPRGEKDLGSIGVTGIRARIYPGVTVTVEDVQLNTPAHGKFNQGDIHRRRHRVRSWTWHITISPSYTGCISTRALVLERRPASNMHRQFTRQQGVATIEGRGGKRNN